MNANKVWYNKNAKQKNFQNSSQKQSYKYDNSSHLVNSDK